MPSHFSAIGIPIHSHADLNALADQIGPLATPIAVAAGTYWRWTSDCGAEVWLQTNTDHELVGMTPYFSGGSRVSIRLIARVRRDDDTALEGALHGWVDPDPTDDASGAYPIVFDAVDFCQFADLALPAIAETRVVAFAHEVSLFPSVAAYEASQTGSVRFASKSFFPTGLFHTEADSSEPPASTAAFTGHVVASAVKTNELTGMTYYWALVETYGGVFDVVIDPDLCREAPKVGAVLSGSFWLCGRIVI